MGSELTIRLSFHQDDSRMYPTGYWMAAADAAGSPEYDGVGLTPLDAAMALAKELYAAEHAKEGRRDGD